MGLQWTVCCPESMSIAHPSIRKISFYQYCFLGVQVDTQMGSGKESSWQCRRCRFNPWVWNIPLEEEMANYSNILAWEILWTEEPGGLQSMGSQRVRHDWSYSAHHKHPVTMATSVGCLCGDPLKSGKWTPCGYKHELPDLTGGPSSCTPNTPRNPLSQECLPVR